MWFIRNSHCVCLAWDFLQQCFYLRDDSKESDNKELARPSLFLRQVGSLKEKMPLFLHLLAEDEQLRVIDLPFCKHHGAGWLI
ncbi:hypothetical protein AOLI_G00295120 [Acnodon oligacanthus]